MLYLLAPAAGFALVQIVRFISRRPKVALRFFMPEGRLVHVVLLIPGAF